MSDPSRRGRALLEVVLVLIVTLAAVGLVARSPIARWELTHLHRPFGEYLALALVPLAVILASRLPVAGWGLAFHPLREQVDSALKCLVPFAVAQVLTMAVRHHRLLHSIVESLAAVAVLVVCARLLRLKPSPGVAIPAIAFVGAAHATSAKAVSALVFYPLLLGPAEELLFRGFIQSRLNQAFGRPRIFMRAPFGAGLIITAVLFSLFHVANLPKLYFGSLEPLWLQALPTFVWGLFFGYLRERTGSLLAPAIVHGVPQGLAWAFLGL